MYLTDVAGILSMLQICHIRFGLKQAKSGSIADPIERRRTYAPGKAGTTVPIGSDRDFAWS